VRLGLIGGLVGAIAMGFAAYAIPVPGTGGEPFFVVFAIQMGLSSIAVAAGWALHLSTGLLVGGVLGFLVGSVPRLRVRSLGRGVAVGVLAGVTAWVVLFVPALSTSCRGFSPAKLFWVEDWW
jgi:hypothetical protein